MTKLTKSDLLQAIAGFEDNVEIQILIPGEEPYEIKKVTTDGLGTVYLIADT